MSIFGDGIMLIGCRVFGIPTIIGGISTVVFWFMYKDLDEEEFSLVSASEQEEKEHAH